MGGKQSQTCIAHSGWLHQRPPQTIQSQYCITMVGLTNNNSAYFLFQQGLRLDITHFTPHFIWLYQDSKEQRQYLSAQISIMQINKTNSSSRASNSRFQTLKYTLRDYSIWGIMLLSSWLSHRGCCCQGSRILELGKKCTTGAEMEWKIKINTEKSIQIQSLYLPRPNHRVLAIKKPHHLQHGHCCRHTFCTCVVGEAQKTLCRARENQAGWQDNDYYYQMTADKRSETY